MESVCHGYMCILLYVKLIWCSGFPEIYAWLEDGAWGQSAMGICAFFFMSNFCSVVVFQRSMLDWRRGMGSFCHGYMCILLYVKLIWCSGFPEIYAWMEEGAWCQSAMGICAFFYMSNFCSVVVFQRFMLNWRRRHGVILPWVHVHSSICQTSAVQWFSRDLCSIRGGGIGSVCHGYMSILLYVKLNWCSSFPEIYAWLEEGAWSQSAMGICAFFYMWNLFCVVVFQRSMLDWRRGMGSVCHGYMCILLYVKLIQCSGIA